MITPIRTGDFTGRHTANIVKLIKASDELGSNVCLKWRGSVTALRASRAAPVGEQPHPIIATRSEVSARSPADPAEVAVACSWCAGTGKIWTGCEPYGGLVGTPCPCGGQRRPRRLLLVDVIAMITTIAAMAWMLLQMLR
jgi:hypothetical protein